MGFFTNKKNQRMVAAVIALMLAIVMIVTVIPNF